jgi:hypothetical protein
VPASISVISLIWAWSPPPFSWRFSEGANHANSYKGRFVRDGDGLFKREQPSTCNTFLIACIPTLWPSFRCRIRHAVEALSLISTDQLPASGWAGKAVPHTVFYPQTPSQTLSSHRESKLGPFALISASSPTTKSPCLGEHSQHQKSSLPCPQSEERKSNTAQ